MKQPQKVQDKIYKIIEAIETLERVPFSTMRLAKTQYLRLVVMPQVHSEEGKHKNK